MTCTIKNPIPGPTEDPVPLHVNWRVENGCFIGAVLIDLEPAQGTMGMKKKPEEGWLPFAHDLRMVNGIKQRKPEDPTACCLYHNNEFIATVNASFEDLLPHWLKWRSVFDNATEVTGEVPDPAIMVHR